MLKNSLKYLCMTKILAFDLLFQAGRMQDPFFFIKTVTSEVYATELLQTLRMQLTENEIIRFSSKISQRHILHLYRWLMYIKLLESHILFLKFYGLQDYSTFLHEIFIFIYLFIYLFWCGGGDFKGKIYNYNPHKIEELKMNIRNEFTKITQHELAKVT